MLHSVHPPPPTPPLSAGELVNLLLNFKKRGLDKISIFRGGLLECLLKKKFINKNVFLYHN